MVVLDKLVSLFAIVGLIAGVALIFRRGWSVGYKAAALFFLAAFSFFIANDLFNGGGHAGLQDYGVVKALAATFGVVMVVDYFRPHFTAWWHWALAGSAVLLIMATAWYGVLTQVVPSSPPSQQQLVRPAPTTNQHRRQTGTRSGGNSDDPCKSDLSYSLKKDLGCP